MIAEAWETRVEGPLVFSYQPDSYVEQHLDSIVASYQKALADVSAFLGVPSGGLPRISIYLCEFLPEVDGQAGGETRRSPDAAEIWTTVNSESPGADPEVPAGADGGRRHAEAGQRLRRRAGDRP